MRFAALSLALLMGVASSATSAETIHALFLLEGSAPRESLLRGVRFGIAEARHTAQLFGRECSIAVIVVRDGSEAQRVAASYLHAPRTVAFIGFAGRGATAGALARLDVPVIAILDRGDEGPAGAVFRLRPDTTAAAALRRQPGVPAGASMVAWHPSLRRFGATELNDRFLRSTGHQMDEDAWLGWLAVKVIIESSLRRVDPSALKFDGHKGVPLRFDGSRALVQPLYATTRSGSSEVIHEATP